MTTAFVHIDTTSATCIRYTLVDQAGEVIWRNRIIPCTEGHEGARRRMATWALKHKVVVTVRQAQPASADRGRR